MVTEPHTRATALVWKTPGAWPLGIAQMNMMLAGGKAGGKADILHQGGGSAQHRGSHPTACWCQLSSLGRGRGRGKETGLPKNPPG